MKILLKDSLRIGSFFLLANASFGQNTPIDAVAAGPHLFFEARNIVVINDAATPRITFDVYMSASQAYVDYVKPVNEGGNGPDFGLESVDVAYDVDFGTDGTANFVLPVNGGNVAVKESNQLNSVQGQTNIQGNSPAGFDTKFKFTFFRLPGSDPLSTTPTRVVSSTVTWPAGTIIGTPANGAKIQLRCEQTGYGTGLSGSKWGDLSGNNRNIVGSTARVTALPVTLASFVASKEGNTAVLSWTTAEETNSDRFDVQRSQDGKSWSKILTVAALGDSRTDHTYQAIDDSPLDGTNLYRLHMIDKDGSNTYSKIQKLTFNVEKSLVMYPNPVSDELSIKSANWDKVSAIQIFDANGLEMYKSGSIPQKRINVAKFTPGIYLVKVTEGNIVSNYKVLVSR